MLRSSHPFAPIRLPAGLAGRFSGAGLGARSLAVVLAVALFGVQALQPMIGLVEVTRLAHGDKVDQVDRDAAPAMPETVVVTVRAWHWHEPGAISAAFVIQPGISTSAAGSAQAGAAWLPAHQPSPPAAMAVPPSRPGSADILRADARVDHSLRLAWCRQISRTGPPAA